MALLTSLPLDAARELAAQYGLTLAELEPLVAGSVNSNFRLKDAGGSTYFLRIYEEQDRAGAAREVALLQDLGRAGVPSAAPAQRQDGQWLSEYQGKPVAVFPWIHGESLCQARVTPEHCARIGNALGRVHTVRPKELAEGRFRVSDLEARLASIEAQAPVELASAAVSIRNKLTSYAARRDPTLPEGLIHGDLFKDNVLWQGQELRALLDFESASRGPFAFDVMVTLMAWCYSDHFELELARSLLAGYVSARPLAPCEIAALPIEAGIAALRFATTRITDFSMRTPPGATPARDYRRFLARLTEIEAGALEHVFASLG